MATKARRKAISHVNISTKSLTKERKCSDLVKHCLTRAGMSGGMSILPNQPSIYNFNHQESESMTTTECESILRFPVTKSDDLSSFEIPVEMVLAAAENGLTIKVEMDPSRRNARCRYVQPTVSTGTGLTGVSG